MNYAANSALRLKLEAWRARLMVIVFMAIFAGLGVRAFYLQGLHNDFLQQKGETRYERRMELTATRGMIADRNGEPLAMSTPVESIWASPDDVEMKPAQLKALAKLLNLAPAQIKAKLKDKSKTFVFLKRQISPEQAAQVMALKIPGLAQQREYRRYYPAGAEMAHVVGFTGMDENGQEGMELAFDRSLVGKAGSRRVIKNRRGEIIEDVDSIKLPQHGKDITLSIDSKLQYLAYRELKAAVKEHGAKGGALVMIDVPTGEILALVNQPDFNPNNRGKLTGEKMRNRTFTDTFEPGSTMKTFSTALALEMGRVRPDSLIDTTAGTFTIGNNTIRDDHPAQEPLTVSQVLQKSSNVGIAKMIQGIAPAKHYEFLAELGFGAAPQLGFPGEAEGRLRPHKSWRPIEQITMAYGYGLSVSLMQLTRAYTVFASDGELVDLSLIKTATPPPARPVISSKVARQVLAMLETVTQTGGTAPRAAVPGYRVAGKTGTARKLDGKGYSSTRYVSSFIGMAPASNPRIVIGVIIDEPAGDAYYGGLVAAPVFSAVMSGALRTLGVPMDAPLKEASLPLGEPAEVREEG